MLASNQRYGSKMDNAQVDCHDARHCSLANALTLIAMMHAIPHLVHSLTHCFVQVDVKCKKKVKPYTSDGVFKKKLWHIDEEDTKISDKRKFKIIVSFTLHIGQGEAKRPCQMIIRTTEDISFFKTKRVIACIDEAVLAYRNGNN